MDFESTVQTRSFGGPVLGEKRFVDFLPYQVSCAVQLPGSFCFTDKGFTTVPWMQ